jgi:protein-L-isoaspartate(D-aspartate) O-methyltransferase
MEGYGDPKREWEDLVQRLIREGILRSPRVIQAFRRIPREPFLYGRERAYAAVDTPLPIGFGQTISAPLS